MIVRPLALALALVCFGCDNIGSSQDAGDDALGGNPFLGNWRITMFDGGPGNNVTWTFGEASVAVSTAFSGTYTFDSDESLQQIELSLTGAIPNPNRAIYRFNSSTEFLLKVQDGATARATTFDVETDYDVFVMTKL